MPIIDQQRRLREVGRIRLGEQVPNKNGNGTHPSKLSKFRFTSSDEVSINLVAKQYGGEVQPWSGASVGEAWELYTDSKDLDVIVPPIDLAFSQWNELWSGGGCQRRCDGQTNLITDRPCICDPDNQECKPTTRLGVILTAVNGIGVWRLETHGFAAAAELNGAIEILRVVQNRGVMAPARLLLEQRQQKRINTDGKPETFNFAVPVLDLNLSVAALTGGSVNTPQITSGATPIESAHNEIPSVVDQVEALSTPIEKPKRSNAAAPITATGIEPRTVTTIPIVEDTSTPPDGNERPEAYTPPADEPLLTEPQGKNIGRLFSKLNIKEREARLEFLVDHFHHPFDSSKQLTKKEAIELIKCLMVLAGEEEKSRTRAPQSAPPSEYDEYSDEKF